MKQKHDAINSNDKHVNKKEKEMGIERHTLSVTNLISYKRFRMFQLTTCYITE
ncbi:hypothetical protein HYC85_029313 [Camellia sinensis]|uniref:Uncharacterized protein n=1 Tax=Camellia sinensis TaxID=4442 RepID=A0A7J7FXQ8_CAMSI|nr:hypothetical protein HYC85_029313 [Camellia sinensis]